MQLFQPKNILGIMFGKVIVILLQLGFKIYSQIKFLPPWIIGYWVLAPSLINYGVDVSKCLEGVSVSHIDLGYYFPFSISEVGPAIRMDVFYPTAG